MSCTVIIASKPDSHMDKCVALVEAINSVLLQPDEVKCLLVFDGKEGLAQWHTDTLLAMASGSKGRFTYQILKNNVGAGGWYGHRIYSAFSLLCSTTYVAFLDDDCTLEADWYQSMIAGFEFNPRAFAVTCRRNIVYKGERIGVDNNESIGVNKFGYSLFDINTYMIKQDKVSRHVVPYLYNKWGADRILAEHLLVGNRCIHIANPLVNYAVRDDRITFYRSIL